MTAYSKEWQEFLKKERKVQEVKMDDREESLEADETENAGEKVQQKLAAAQPASVSIQLDGWSQHHHGYMGLMLNFINKDLRRAKLCLACAPVYLLI